MTVILDNGHGNDTTGKRSPVWADGRQLFEWEFNRDIVRRVSSVLKALGINHRVLVPEQWDVPLAERVARANRIHSETRGQCFLVSVHANAGGGTGWEAWTSVGQTKADEYAGIFYECAEKEFGGTWKIRKDTGDGDADKEAGFYILRKTKCPAVLTENFFMDTERDCRFIMGDEGRTRVANMHIQAIREILKI